MGRTIAVCRTEREVREFLARSTPIDAWLALTPPAALALATRGIAYEKLTEGPGEDRAGMHGLLERQVRWALFVDERIHAHVPAIAATGYRPAIASFYWFKNLVDPILLHRNGLDRLLARERPSKLLWGGPLSRRHRFHPFDFTAAVLPVVAREHGVALEVVSTGDDPEPAQSRFGRARIWKLLGHVRRNAHAAIARARDGMRAAARPTVAVLQDEYDVHATLPALRARGMGIVRPNLDAAALPPDPDIAAGLARAWREITEDARFWSFLDGWTGGRAVVEPEISRWWHSHIPTVERHRVAAREELRRRPVDALLVANALALPPPGEGYMLAARAAGLPVFGYIHGALPGHCDQPLYALLDPPRVDTFFTYSRAVAGYIQGVADRLGIGKTRVVGGGSARIDGLRAAGRPPGTDALRRSLQRADPRPLVLYVPTFFSEERRLAGDMYAPVSYFEMQKQVIDLFVEHPEARLVYRGTTAGNGPWHDLVPELVRSRLPGALVVSIGEVSLADLIWAVDAIVLDFPATSLGEILLTSKPAIVYCDRRYAWFLDDAKACLARRATVVETPQDLVASLRALLERRDFGEVATPDRSFMSRYMTDGDDGRSADRVADAIASVLAGKPIASVTPFASG